MKRPSIFISGIDTDAGKTYATAWLANRFAGQGLKVITQKMVQTGNTDFSEDIEVHRRLMGCGLLPEDRERLTCPEIYSYPASAHLAARIDKRPVSLDKIDKARQELESRYDLTIVEGAGGLMVPVSEEYLTIDYIKSRRLPVALVTNGKLGSINHTILSLEALASRGIDIEMVIYNPYFDYDPVVCGESRSYIGRYIRRIHPGTEYLVMD